MNDYAAIGSTLEASYSAPRYFNYLAPQDTDPLAALVPLVGMERCFGTKVRNLFVVRKPYGWSNASAGGEFGTYSWPPAGYEDSKARLIEAYPYFASYETLVWMDLSFDCGDCPDGSSYCDMMLQTEEGIEAMCTELADYGFTYMGPITDGIDESFFEPYIDEHFSA